MRGNDSESVRLTTDTTEFPRLIQVYRSLLAAVVLVPCLASAQAWLPDKGEFNTSLVYNDVYNKQHYLPNGDLTYAGGAHVRSKTIAFLGSYGITDRLMVQAALPYVETKYWGPPSHGGAPDFNADDGGTHGFLTDLRVTLHYQLLEEPFALAPFIGYVLPTNNNYFVKGHAAQGRGLDELLVGFGAGKNLDEWIPRTYTQMKYTYAFVENKDVFGLTVRVQYFNVTNGRRILERTVYTGPRNGSPVSFHESRDQAVGPIFEVSVRGTF